LLATCFFIISTFSSIVFLPIKSFLIHALDSQTLLLTLPDHQTLELKLRNDLLVSRTNTDKNVKTHSLQIADLGMISRRQNMEYLNPQSHLKKARVVINTGELLKTPEHTSVVWTTTGNNTLIEVHESDRGQFYVFKRLGDGRLRDSSRYNIRTANEEGRSVYIKLRSGWEKLTPAAVDGRAWYHFVAKQNPQNGEKAK